jgi:hypothetical protein
MAVIAMFVAACGGDNRGPIKDSPSKRLTELKDRMADSLDLASKASCEITTPKLQAPIHVDSIDGVKYSSDPPTSGKHLQQWGAWGYYRKVLPDGNAIHNLEHGGVVLWYGKETIPAMRLALIQQKVLDKGEKWIVTPRPGSTTVDLAAWGMLMKCSPEGLAKLSDDEFVDLLDGWFDAANSQGSPQEKAIPAYASDYSAVMPEQNLSVKP